MQAAALLSWIPFFLLRQVFPSPSTCLNSSFPSQASIPCPFYLPGFHFFPLRQVSPAPFTCLESFFLSQASIPLLGTTKKAPRDCSLRALNCLDQKYALIKRIRSSASFPPPMTGELVSFTSLGDSSTDVVDAATIRLPCW